MYSHDVSCMLHKSKQLSVVNVGGTTGLYIFVGVLVVAVRNSPNLASVEGYWYSNSHADPSECQCKKAVVHQFGKGLKYTCLKFRSH